MSRWLPEGPVARAFLLLPDVPARGPYGLEVDVRNHGSTVAYDKVANLYYSLANVPCTTPSFTTSPASQSGTGAHVTLTASTSGCANPVYRFWISAPGQQWTIVQDYGTASTYTWTGTGAAGTYRMEVDVRNQSGTAAYETVSNLTFAVN